MARCKTTEATDAQEPAARPSKLKTAQVTLGDHDGVRILEAADNENATALRLQWGAAVNVHPMTFHAFTAAGMDRILVKVNVLSMVEL